MKTPSPLLTFFLFLLFSASTAYPPFGGESSIYVPGDYILLDCGSTGQNVDSDNRTWNGDASSEYAPLLTSPGASASNHDSSVPQYPFFTARIFPSPYTYSFPLTIGRKFLRLYFYPSNYSGQSASDAIFSVTAGLVILLRNFSASQTAQSLNFAYIIREFSLHVSSTVLNITFTPSANHSNAFAFINGIEIVSMPDIFSPTIPLLVTISKTPSEYPIKDDWAMQTAYRLNVGGQAISPTNDSGLYRSWANDSPYIYGTEFGVTYSADPNVTIEYSTTIPHYVAPTNVYATARSMGPDPKINLNYNLSWILPVDAGFYYLVRLHFCEISFSFTESNQRVFDIFLNNQTAQEGADVIAWSSGIGKPVYEDYVVITSGYGMVDLWLSLHPDTKSKPEYFDSILNGIEVFKVQDSDNNLAGPNPDLLPEPNVKLDMILDKEDGSRSKVAAIVGGMVGAAAFLVLVFMACRRRRRKKLNGWLTL